jgi:hypothetical protein
MTSKLLTFKLKWNKGIRDLYAQFHPGGQRVLNRTEWRGHPPRSCAITRLSGKGTGSGSDIHPFTANIEVTYRPKGYISYTGKTRYDGWTAMVPAEPGKRFKDGEQPSYVPREVYQDIEFNELDFGDFVGEVEVEEVKRTTVEVIFEEMKAGGSMSSSVNATFLAAHRSRPPTTIILTNQPDGEGVDRFGTRIININIKTENLEQVLMERITELMHDFMEGKASITNWCGDNFTFVKLSDVLVDCELNEIGEDSSFNILHHNTPLNFLDDLARQLTALYEVKVEVVTGKDGGLVLRRDSK